jgi:hypothetical protein
MKEAKQLTYLKLLLEKGMYYCSRDKKEKKSDEFYDSQWSITGKFQWCKDCCSQHAKERSASVYALISKELNRIKKINSGKYNAINS